MADAEASQVIDDVRSIVEIEATMELQPVGGRRGNAWLHAQLMVPEVSGGRSSGAVGATSGKTERSGAGDGLRTRYLNLGKVALYRLSYSRAPEAILLTDSATRNCRPGRWLYSTRGLKGPAGPFV